MERTNMKTTQEIMDMIYTTEDMTLEQHNELFKETLHMVREWDCILSINPDNAADLNEIEQLSFLIYARMWDKAKTFYEEHTYLAEELLPMHQIALYTHCYQ